MNEEKKIIIDDDWKSQVAAEKEALQREAEDKKTKAPEEPRGMPPASFEMLLTMFATEAMAALGQLPNPLTNEVSINLEHARYAIDMLQMLGEKTEGNLDAGEKKMLEDLTHQLRMLYVAANSPPPAAPPVN